jgi:hypothetical protein
MSFFNNKIQIGVQPMYGVGNLIWLLELVKNKIIPGYVWSKPNTSSTISDKEWKIFFNKTREIIISVNSHELRYNGFIEWIKEFKPKYVEICNGLTGEVKEIGSQQGDIELLNVIKETGAKIFPKCLNNNSSEFINNIVQHVDGINVKNKDAAGYTSGQSLQESINWAKKFNKPIIASGGITNKEDILTALSYGAESVMLGTVFACTIESNLSDTAKQLIINKNSQDIRRYGKFNQRALGHGELIDNDDGNMTNNYLNVSQNGQNGILFVGNSINKITKLQTIEEVAKKLIG